MITSLDDPQLAGESTFTIAPLSPRHPFDPDAAGVAFMLNDLLFFCFENPDDGYRSHAGPLMVAKCDPYDMAGGACCEYIKEPVTVAHIDDNYFDILRVTSRETGKVIFEIGTGNVDDYYPYFHEEWNPENLSANARGRL
jgi:hypothetical protein